VRKVWPVIVYTVLRLLFFLVPLGLMLLLPVFQDQWWIAVILAAMIGFSLSILVLGRQRGRVAEQLAARNERRRPGSRIDADVEDEAVDASDAPTPESPDSRA
jgi:Protein of unknown function (DUF4229)